MQATASALHEVEEARQSTEAAELALEETEARRAQASHRAASHEHAGERLRAERAAQASAQEALLHEQRQLQRALKESSEQLDGMRADQKAARAKQRQRELAQRQQLAAQQAQLQHLQHAALTGVEQAPPAEASGDAAPETPPATTVA